MTDHFEVVDRRVSRQDLLKLAAAAGGAGLLAGRTGAASAALDLLAAESGRLQVLDWAGYGYDGGQAMFAAYDKKYPKNKPKFTEVQDKFKKSARGPAMALLVMPSNLLLAAGLILTALSLVFFIYGMWPLVFNDAAPGEEELDEAGVEALDLILLWLGPDAHICSLFPGAAELGERERRVVGVDTAGMAPLVSRITLTLPIVNAARSLVFLVTGEDKADAVARAVGPADPMAPASLIEPVSGSLVLICDAAAASKL